MVACGIIAGRPASRVPGDAGVGTTLCVWAKVDLQQFLTVAPPEPPQDFSDFWQRRHAVALAVDPRPQLRAAGWTLQQHVVHDIRYWSTGGVEIGGWMLVPQSGRVTRGLVVGHGYGGRDGPDLPLSLDGCVTLFPCFRGLGRSALPGVSPDPSDHVLHDIQDRNKYVLGGCVEDLWLGVSALLALFPEASDRVAYCGISFGGGIGALAAPWDRRVSRLHLHVPTFGHQALRLTLPCVGSGEAVRDFWRRHRNVMGTLAYYDAASAARYLRIPTLVAAALVDPAVPPPGQFAVYNAIAEPLRRLFVLEAGHLDYPDREAQIEELNVAVARFFMEEAPRDET